MSSSRGTSSREKYVLRSNRRCRKPEAAKKTNRFTRNLTNYKFPRLDSNIKLYARIFWSVCCLLSTGVCIFQLEDRFRFYFSNPTMSHVSITQSDTGHFPPVTLCPANFGDDLTYFLREKMIEQYLKLRETGSGGAKMSMRAVRAMSFGELNMSLASVWEKYELDSSISKNSLSCAGLANKEFCNDKTRPYPVKESTVSTMLGKCSSHTLQEEVEYHGASTYWAFKYGRQNLLNSPKHGGSEGELTFLVADLTPNIIHEVFYSAVTLVFNQHTDVFINSREFQFLNLEHRPCKDGGTIFNCRSQCLNKKLEEQLNCTLPFFNSSILAPCSDYNSSMDAYKRAISAYLTHSHGHCKCLPMCSEVTYSWWVDVLPMKPKKPIKTSFTFYFSDNYREIIEERFMYTFPALLSDIAGNVGFFVGVSVLGALQIIVSIVGYVSRYTTKSKAL